MRYSAIADRRINNRAGAVTPAIAPQGQEEIKMNEKMKEVVY